jgi:hypothetical protein
MIAMRYWFPMSSAVVTLLLLGVFVVHAQEKKEIQCSISYMAASSVYIDAGREQHIVVGDTLRVVRSQKEVGIIVVTAVARVSSAASIVAQELPFVVGDQAVAQLMVVHVGSENSRGDNLDSAKSTIRQNPREEEIAIAKPENVLSGRVAIQYNAIFAEESKFNLYQPAASVRLNIGNLLGTGMRLSVNGRSYYDMSNDYSIYGSKNGLESRAYEVSLVQDALDASFGYGVGRLTSRYVGGMGSFDGAQFYYRNADFTAGILGGAQVVDRTLTFSQNGTKGSFFLNFHHGTDVFHQYDGTIAYGRQMVGSNLDRQFLYLQNSASLGSQLMLYESSEIELNDIANGVRTSAFRFSNTFLNVNYQPFDWLSTNAGYDALRSVYLFETMKMIPDSLIDRNLVQGLRVNATVHMPLSMTLSADARYGSRQGGYRDSHTLGASLRAYDLFGSDIDGGVRYTSFVGAYADGNNITLDLDRSFGRNLSAELRYEYNKYSVSLLQQFYATQTASADVFYRLSSSWFTSLSGDYIYDPTMTSFRFYVEFGFRF